MKFALKDRRKEAWEWLLIIFLLQLGGAWLYGGQPAVVGFLWGTLAAFTIWLVISLLLAGVVLMAAYLGGPFSWRKKDEKID